VVIGILILLGGLYYFQWVKKRAIDFHLTNWDGRPVSMDTLKGKVVILTFSYAYCSVRCPVVTVRLLSLDWLLNSPEDVVYVHVGVDPDNDTPEHRRKYFALYRIDIQKDDRWVFVSGDRDELQRMWEFYGINTHRVKEEDLPEGYYIEYTPKIFLIDRKGFIRYETDINFVDEEFAQRVRRIIG